MDIENNTEQGLTQGDLQTIVALAVLEANAQGWLVWNAEFVSVGWDKQNAEYVVMFRLADDKRTTIRVERTEVELHFQKAKEAKRPKYLETLCIEVSNAAGHVYTAAANVAALDCPASLADMANDLSAELNTFADQIDRLVADYNLEEDDDE